MPTITALAEVDICNMGLSMIGITSQIQSIGDKFSYLCVQ
jgi:hypothetical protein